MSPVDTEIRSRLSGAAASVQLDVEERLRQVHRKSRRREQGRRVGAGLVALAVAAAGTAFAVRLLPLTGRDETRPGASPAGRIAYTVVTLTGEDESYVIYAADGDGTSVARLSAPEGNAYVPVWSPDGQHVAFIEGTSELGERIVVARADGSAPRVVVEGAESIISVAWSSDGRQLAYVEGDDPDGAVWTVSVEGGQPRRVVSGHWRNVAWSPVGDRLLLAGYRGDYESSDLYLVEVEGGDLTRIVEGSMDEDFAVWSPDGTRIAFVRHVANFDDIAYRSDVYVSSAEGDDVRRLTDWEGFDGFPVWSPDGTRIAFSSDRSSPGEGFGQGFAASIFVMNADGSGVRTLLTAPEGADLTVLVASSWAR
jgi:Tol biopolymer transport system component